MNFSRVWQFLSSGSEKTLKFTIFYVDVTVDSMTMQIVNKIQLAICIWTRYFNKMSYQLKHNSNLQQLSLLVGSGTVDVIERIYSSVGRQIKEQLLRRLQKADCNIVERPLFDSRINSSARSI